MENNQNIRIRYWKQKFQLQFVFNQISSPDRNAGSLKDVWLKADKIPIVIEKEFSVKCFVRGHPMYKIECEAKIGYKLKASQKTRPGTLRKIKYAMALNYNDVTVEHVSKYLSKIAFSSETRSSFPRDNN